MRLDGIEFKQGSLKEAYLASAVLKRNRVEAKKVVALATAGAGAKGTAIKEAVDQYLMEVSPSLEKQQEAFLKMGQEILAKEAGKLVDMSRYAEGEDTLTDLEAFGVTRKESR